MPATEKKFCPFCGGDLCPHFLGWTDDGRTLEAVEGRPWQPVPDGARVVKAGGSALVYQQTAKE